jgi:catechol 2,3-dioxygenase
VHLAVTDLEVARRFYEEVVGLTALSAGDDGTRMGAHGVELVVLHPGAKTQVAQHRTGLYHLAIVVPDRRELARVIARASARGVYNSPTDHTLTKSDYLWDPDGNGIEVYTESPEDGTWTFLDDGFAAVDRDGRPRSGRDPIDLDQLFAELKPGDRLEQPMPPGTKMGHVHLHVAHIRDALDFYTGLVGFELQGVSRRFGAAFISAGGYHHHLGLNTWAGEGAPPAPEGSAGLRHYTIEVPGESDLEPVLDRLRGAGLAVSQVGSDFEVVDPSQNRVRLRARGARAEALPPVTAHSG